MTNLEAVKFIKEELEKIDKDTFTRYDKDNVNNLIERFKGISVRDAESYDFIMLYKETDSMLAMFKKLMKIK